MSDFTFIHAADIHLDSPLRGLERYDGAPVEEIRNATRRAFVKLVDLAIEEAVQFVVIAGDVYDGDWKDYNTGLFFAKQMSRLREKDIPVYILAGNHDAASVLSKQLRLPENVHRFSDRHPETFRIPALGVALHGQGFASRAIPENLSTHYPPAVAGCFNIGVLHTCATGREGHDAYAPCSLSDLSQKGYNYWALGHVHTREVLSEEPWIVFPGNIQGRHIREQGPKGCTLVSISNQEVVSVEARDLDVLRWAEVEIIGSEVACAGDATEGAVEALRIAVEENNGCPLAARIVLHGPCPAHAELSRGRENLTAELRAVAMDRFGEGVWIEKVVIRTQPSVGWEERLHDDSPAADLLRLIDQVGSDAKEITSLVGALDDLHRKVHPFLDDSGDSDEFSPAWIRERLNEVKQEILPRLLDETELK
ncbi:MAG: DNA repair exonuclease [Opitutales bacterium]